MGFSSIYWLSKLEGVQNYHYSSFYEAQHNEDQAAQLFRRSIRHYPQLSPKAYMGLFRTSRSTSDSSFIREGLRWFPDQAHLHFGIGHFYHKLERDTQASYHIQKAFNLAPDDIDLYEQLALQHSQRGDWTAAVRVYEEAIDIEPENENLLYKFACTTWSAGDIEECILALTKILNLNKENMMAWHYLGVISYQIGQYEEARIKLEKSHNLYLNYITKNRHFGSSLRYNGLVIPEDHQAYLYLFLGNTYAALEQPNRASEYHSLARKSAANLAPDHTIHAIIPQTPVANEKAN